MVEAVNSDVHDKRQRDPKAPRKERQNSVESAGSGSEPGKPKQLNRALIAPGPQRYQEFLSIP